MSISNADVYSSAALYGWILLVVIFSEALARISVISKESSRKIIHIGVGLVVYIVPSFDTRSVAITLPFAAAGVNYFLSPLSPLRHLQLETFKAGHTLGTILYPISLGILVTFYFETPEKILYCFFPVVFGDGLAAVVGKSVPSKSITLYSGTKSVYGCVTMLVASYLGIVGGTNVLLRLYPYRPFSIDFSRLYKETAPILSIFATIAEALAPLGTDNLVIPMCLLAVIQMRG